MKEFLRTPIGIFFSIWAVTSVLVVGSALARG